MDTPAHEIFLARQPILDRAQQLWAYELLFRSGRQNAARIDDGTAATAAVLAHALTDLGLEAALGPYLGFINLDEQMLLSEVVEMLPREKFVLEVLETVEPTPAIVARCHALKDLGYTLALDDVVALEQRQRPLLALADIVKVDLMGLSEADLAALVGALRRWPVKLLAEKVDNEAQVKRCLALGFELFQGYYFARPALLAGRKLSASQLTLHRLLALVLEEVDTAALEAVLKPEPGLTLNLLRLTNSAASGLRHRIVSLRHAITVLGRRQLARWLQLLIFADAAGNTPYAGPLLALAATRARFMELLAGELMGAEPDLAERAFLTGILSLLPALLQAPLAEILRGLPVADEVRAALEARAGVLGRLLQLAEEVEAGDAGACQALTVELPGLDAERVNAGLTRAMTWAAALSRSLS